MSRRYKLLAVRRYVWYIISTAFIYILRFKKSSKCRVNIPYTKGSGWWFYKWKTIMGFRWNTKWFNFFMFWAKHKPWSLKQRAFRADRYKWIEMGTPYEKWPYEWATAVITLISGVTSLFITCRGPPCTIFSERSCKQWLASMSQVLFILLMEEILHHLGCTKLWK